jgi:hypothetical protein
MVRLLPKTFSNCNQVVSSILKNFDKVLPLAYYAIKHLFRIKQKKKTEKKNYTPVSVNNIKDIQ